MSKRWKLSALTLVLALAMLLSACGGNEKAGGNDQNSGNNGTDNDNTELAIGQKNLTIPYVAWARETLSTHLLANLLEDIGYNVVMRQVEAGPMYSSVADGSADFHVSGALPVTHAVYWDKYEDKLDKVKQVLDKSPLALTVPSYVEDINTMEDLKTNKAFGDAVDWRITGIDPGSGLMQNTELALEEYGLDEWDLQSSSEAAMLAQLKSAMKKEEPIVVTLWKPHWAFGAMDLKMIEDPKEVYGGDGDQIYLIARKGLKEDAPRAYQLLKQYYESYDILGEMMPRAYVDNIDPEDVVQEFIDNNPDLIDEWMEGIPRN